MLSPKLKQALIISKYIFEMSFTILFFFILWEQTIRLKAMWITEHTTLQPSWKVPKGKYGKNLSNVEWENGMLCMPKQCLCLEFELYSRRNLLSRINAISASFCCLRTESERTSEWSVSKQTHQGNYKYVLPYFLLVMVLCFSSCILDKCKVTRVSLCISVMFPWLIIHLNIQWR